MLVKDLFEQNALETLDIYDTWEGKSDAQDYSVQDIEKLIRPVFDALSKIRHQSEYDAFLRKYPGTEAVIDEYFSDTTVHGIADKLHYHQKEPEVQSFLDSLQH